MRLLLTRRWCHHETKSVFGTLLIPTSSQRFLTCEREWLDNTPGKSCVPPGFYHLEPHGTEGETKYWNTFAMVGETVSHFGGEPGVTRSACVMHWASQGKYLQGCIALGESILWGPDGGKLQGKAAGRKFLDILDAATGPHYLTIRDALG